MEKELYEKELRKLQAEIVAVQEWVKNTGQRIVIVFEGRDAAGKGGIIKAITERVSARVFRVVALPAPNDREKTQMYMQRYIKHMPAAGEVVIFDRSWYNRAGVERVMGFCTEAESDHFLQVIPGLEGEIITDGILLFKYWLEVSSKEQEKRFKSRINKAEKQWKLSDMDLEARRRWYEYSRARDLMLDATDTKFSPWNIVPSDDKRAAHLNCIRHLLGEIPYEPLGEAIVTLPKPDKKAAYDDRKTMKKRRFVPQDFG